MTERSVPMNVTKELRETIFSLKHELTYDEFLSKLIKKIPESKEKTQGVKPSRSIKGAS